MLRELVAIKGQGFFLSSDDRLLCSVWASASVQVGFSGYMIDERCQLKYWERVVVPTTDRLETTSLDQFGECAIVSCIATLKSGSARRGQCYVRVRAQRSSGTAMVPLFTFIAGYVTSDYSPVYPGGPLEGPLEGAGMLRSITGTNPAAGAEISETVPTGARWKLLAFRATFVADATVIQRGPSLEFTDGTTAFDSMFLATSVSASVTRTYNFGQQSTAQEMSGVQARTIGRTFPFPLLAGYKLNTVTASLQAGDNWSAPQMLVEEHLEAA